MITTIAMNDMEEQVPSSTTTITRTTRIGAQAEFIAVKTAKETIAVATSIDYCCTTSMKPMNNIGAFSIEIGCYDRAITKLSKAIELLENKQKREQEYLLFHHNNNNNNNNNNETDQNETEAAFLTRCIKYSIQKQRREQQQKKDNNNKDSSITRRLSSGDDDDHEEDNYNYIHSYPIYIPPTTTTSITTTRHDSSSSASNKGYEDLSHSPLPSTITRSATGAVMSKRQSLMLEVILTYNLALAIHLKALDKQQEDKHTPSSNSISGTSNTTSATVSLVKNAMSLYERAFELQMNDDDETSDDNSGGVNFHLTMMIANNLGEIYRVLGNTDNHVECLQTIWSIHVIFVMEYNNKRQRQHEERLPEQPEWLFSMEGFIKNASRLVLESKAARAA